LGTIIFDWKSIVHSLKYSGVFLTLGYNTAIFNILFRVFGKKNVINMDGIEWKRQKWSWFAKLWFWLNERMGCWFGSHLIADHPRIEDHLVSRVDRNKITMIPYGALMVAEADESILAEFKLLPDEYVIVVARPEPENSILEVVKGFSLKKRGKKLVILGDYEWTNLYHREVQCAASDEVVFLGAIYDVIKVSALRFFCRAYVHGHQVGGTNPSLVEALGAGSAVIAHENQFNRWVAKGGAVYFSNFIEAGEAFDKIFKDERLVTDLKIASRKNFIENFQWSHILKQYEDLLVKFVPKDGK
jgi:glycosyltransferase involved in cell wall biosynthesis